LLCPIAGIDQHAKGKTAAQTKIRKRMVIGRCLLAVALPKIAGCLLGVIDHRLLFANFF
jgi:hypothetical protein